MPNKNVKKWLWKSIAAPLLMWMGVVLAAGPTPGEYRVAFDDAGSGFPAGWKAEATNPRGALAEWKVVQDGNAVSKPNVLTISKIHDASSGVFNLLWTDKIVFTDGEMEVHVRGNTGRQDQGGGLIWRVQDANNYYVTRYNPLEKNLRLYYLKDGSRRLLASSEGLRVGTGEWFTIKVAHRGTRIEVRFNGSPLLAVEDATLVRGGGVGLWSKADAASSFDNLVVRVSK